MVTTWAFFNKLEKDFFQLFRLIGDGAFCFADIRLNVLEESPRAAVVVLFALNQIGKKR